MDIIEKARLKLFLFKTQLAAEKVSTFLEWEDLLLRKGTDEGALKFAERKLNLIESLINLVNSIESDLSSKQYANALKSLKNLLSILEKGKPKGDLLNVLKETNRFLEEFLSPAAQA